MRVEISAARKDGMIELPRLEGLTLLGPREDGGVPRPRMEMGALRGENFCKVDFARRAGSYMIVPDIMAGRPLGGLLHDRARYYGRSPAGRVPA
jgi:hypothetical protein